jgi:UDP-2,3-diacylglucosamine pyrophosphatase LpxH
LTTPSQPDLVILSDLHLGRGKNTSTGRYYELETFFYDEDFRRFCEYLCNESAQSGRDFKLIFNGDAFDFLRLDKVAMDHEPQQRFAPVLTPSRAAAEVASVLSGHPVFVEGLARVLEAGHQVIFLPGNHDIELQWAPVQEAMRAAIAKSTAFASPIDAARAVEHLEFRPWFYYEPGRIWIEHGCQYDPENAFRYPLRQGLVDVPESVHEAELDNPLGNFFQRYLYNAFGHITFIVPSTRANARYLKWLTINQPMLLLRIVRSHWRFWWQILRRVSKYPSRERGRIAEQHQRELEQLAASSGLGDKLVRIDELKEFHTDLYSAIRGFGVQAIRFTLLSTFIGSLVLGLWFAGYHAINQLQFGLLGKAGLFLIFGFTFLLSAFGTALYMLFRTDAAVPPQPMRRAAAKIADILDVPVVTFGHTHDEVVWRLPRRRADAWYFNTGTWIAVFTHDVLLPRERVQFTYLHVRDEEASLLHWSPGRGEPLPVILLDEAGLFGAGGKPMGEAPP